MSEYLSLILEWINAHPHLAGLATFIISAAESIAIIGTIIPGTVMMTAIGTLAGAGVMPLWSTLLWAILGAIVGDGVSYWIGYYFKNRLRNIWPFSRHPALLDTGIRFFHKHGGKSVFIGRFVGPVRALVPLVAGMLHMKPWRFTVANVISAIGWAPAYMFPGIMLGAASLELPPDIAVHAILMLLLIGLFIILCVWLVFKIFTLIRSRIHAGLNYSWHRLQNSRYFFPIASILKHHNPQKTAGQLTQAFYLILTLFAFSYLAYYIHTAGSSTLTVNDIIYHLFRSLRTPLGDTVFLNITFFGQSKLLLPVMGVFFCWLGLQGRFRTAFHLLMLMLITICATELVKNLVGSERPWGIFRSPHGKSFPSGHAVFSMVFFTGWALLLARTGAQRYRFIIYSLAALIVTAICVSRIYLGAHWFTDVLGGVLLGAVILMLIALSYNRKPEKPLYFASIFGMVFIPLMLCYGIYFSLYAPTLKQNYTYEPWPIESVPSKAWWQQTDKTMPLFRLNRFGFATQVLNLQWIGHLEDIHQTLLKNGWESAEEFSWITALHRLSNVKSTEHLPLVSPLYYDQKPMLVLVKHTNTRLMALRLWRANIKLTNTALPLWVGTVELVPSTYGWLFKRKRNNDVNLNPSILFTTQPKDIELKQIKIKNIYRPRQEIQTIILIQPKDL